MPTAKKVYDEEYMAKLRAAQLQSYKEAKKASYKIWYERCGREYQRKYREEHREEAKAYQRKYRKNHPERIREYNKRYHQKLKNQ